MKLSLHRSRGACRSRHPGLDRSKVLVTAIDGDGCSEDADVIVYSISPKGDILDKPE